MSVTSILAARGREIVNTRARPVEDPGRTKVEGAVEVLLTEITRLKTLQRAQERREERDKRARADNAQFAEAAGARAAARQAARAGTVAVDKKWLTVLVNEILDDWRILAAEASKSGKQMRADYVCSRIDALKKDVAKIEEQDRLFGSQR
jgi:hypothetical protein